MLKRLRGDNTPQARLDLNGLAFPPETMELCYNSSNINECKWFNREE
jgi:hypothetical protein